MSTTIETQLKRLIDRSPDAPNWQELGLCAQADPELFHPDGRNGAAALQAKQICRRCDVRAECLEFALSNDERDGVWGGLTARERRKLQRRSQATTGTEG